ncbi:MAG TPA: TIGR03086 family metal-binding protein [Kineosporiaceae bacterium]|jgi:uncharacterized protein (TIGR03086 family)|nr:TIGR03086 family metal-binding protein [Kineosporiaceae bacterium]
MTDHLVDQLAQLLDTTGQLVAGIGDEQWTAPTPCTEWSVRDLVDHLVAGNLLFAGILSGRVTMADAGRLRGVDQLNGDQLGDRPVAAYRAAADAVVSAAGRPGVQGQTFTLPVGTVPGVVALHLRLTEVLVHGWDLARATGQVVAFPDDVVVQELEFTRGALSLVPAGATPFAPPRPVRDEAPAIDRLAACLGRDVTPNRA